MARSGTDGVYAARWCRPTAVLQHFVRPSQASSPCGILSASVAGTESDPRLGRFGNSVDRGAMENSTLAASRPIQIGQILIEHGVLSEQQVFEIVQAQRCQSLPFGVLAERMFDVTVESIESAWVDQYERFTGEIDLEDYEIDARTLKLLNRRQAWQFEMLPIGFQEEGELLMAASRKRLARAVTFVANRLEPVVFFRIADSQQLREFLRRHYPMPELSDELLRRAAQLVE